MCLCSGIWFPFFCSRTAARVSCFLDGQLTIPDDSEILLFFGWRKILIFSPNILSSLFCLYPSHLDLACSYLSRLGKILAVADREGFSRVRSKVVSVITKLELDFSSSNLSSSNGLLFSKNTKFMFYLHLIPADLMKIK